ncbi:DUF2442 domain-containing protein [Pseudazoarcus pumilus]|uniref:DUF2442 domain-containing protein n=1 Tax=Pseudazoarcus pumilus TaxID=2067960 RepID=A0A2I6S9T1_9RHOO|nr:DUF2442 domain-containing protein [Pseudazoarcus pumilus]AUN96018.1 DUF2442 domain-containing protein [Pseudazoarcus pumilus]
MNEILRITSVTWVGGHRLSLRFSDGTSKVVDVWPLLNGPVFEPLREEAYFSRGTLDSVCGTVVWPNGADFAPEALKSLAAETASAT